MKFTSRKFKASFALLTAAALTLMPLPALFSGGDDGGLTKAYAADPTGTPPKPPIRS